MNTIIQKTTKGHPVVSHEDWISASQKLLEAEKALTRHRDEVNQLRLNNPWELVEKEYTFKGPEGTMTLADLFDGRSQLIIYHFMFGPGWEEGCSGCSFVCDHIDAARQHFEHHDVSIAAVSRAPWNEFEPFKHRMGWTFRWVSSAENDFNYDFGASFRRSDLDAGSVFYNFKMQKLNGDEQPGLSSFFKDSDGKIYHSYSSYERGLDLLVGAYNWLDVAPLGRNETQGMDWMTFHDRYEEK